jgi:hypothetical protein
MMHLYSAEKIENSFMNIGKKTSYLNEAFWNSYIANLVIPNMLDHE